MDVAGHRAEETITEMDPPHHLAFTWGKTSEVVFDLEPRGEQVLLTLTHRKLPTEEERKGTASGWQCHLAILVDKVHGRVPPAFWDVFRRVGG